MTYKQKVKLVAAQYAARALTMTRHADVLVDISDDIEEDRAKAVYEAMERFGFVDSEGLLKGGASTDIELLDKIGGVN